MKYKSTVLPTCNTQNHEFVQLYNAVINVHYLCTNVCV